ncbi:hypothetical protein ACFLIM_44930 [Nonomuraea sp. M3C6]|uniref:Transposase n=1 Tax=Nonomuraea marmarensis TaxID=3351344 RepID=A0ABW7ASF2_9ACTN
MHADLRDLDGDRVGRKRVGRLMRVTGVSRRKGCRTTITDKRTAPDLSAGYGPADSSASPPSCHATWHHQAAPTIPGRSRSKTPGASEGPLRFSLQA